MKLRSRKLAAVLAVVCAIGVGSMGAYSYFSASAESKVNTFNIASSGDGSSVIINEPGWDEDDAKDLEPGQFVTKDPYVKSNLAYDGWVIMKVTVPKCSAKMDADTDFKKYEAVNLKNVDTAKYTLLDTVDGNNDVVYYYGYKTVITSGQQTTPLFSGIQVKDFTAIENEFASAVTVDASVIQKIDPSTGSAFVDVTKAFEALGAF